MSYVFQNKTKSNNIFYRIALDCLKLLNIQIKLDIYEKYNLIHYQISSGIVLCFCESVKMNCSKYF